MTAKDFGRIFYVCPFGEPGAAPVVVSENQSDNVTLKKRSPRKPTLASVKKQADKAGIEVARYEHKPDGTIVTVPGKSDGNLSVTERNEWDEVLTNGEVPEVH